MKHENRRVSFTERFSSWSNTTNLVSKMASSTSLRSSCRWGVCISLWVVLCCILSGIETNAFQVQQPTRSHRNGVRMYQSQSTLDDHSVSDFQQRLFNRMNNAPNRNIKSQSTISRREVQNPYIQEVRTLKDYKRVVIDENPDNQLVVVWFYSPWCRSCKGVSKAVQALSREYKDDIRFVQVPVLPDNATLHQGLGVTSVPFVHVYHPTEGLVEELKLTRKYVLGFHKLLKDYRNGECSLEQMLVDDSPCWSTDSPYEPANKSDHDED